MIDLTNNDEPAMSGFSGSDHGIRGFSDRDNDIINIATIEDDLDPDDQSAGIFGEGVNNDTGQDPVGVWGRAVLPGISNDPGFGYGGIFESTYIGVIGLVQNTPTDGIGVFGRGNSGSFAGVVGQDNGADWAGYFEGDIRVTGDVMAVNEFSAGSKNFKIDHPLAPTEKYLFHATVESPERKNIYDGVVMTDTEGFATVTLPDYFEALNTDFRYQLTVIGSFTQAIIKEKIEDNQFVIQTAEGSIEVSWQVTGVRKDAYSLEYPLEVEVEKPAELRGSYLHPGAFGQEARSGELLLRARTPRN